MFIEDKILSTTINNFWTKVVQVSLAELYTGRKTQFHDHQEVLSLATEGHGFPRQSIGSSICWRVWGLMS
jgi:hypothetical protein